MIVFTTYYIVLLQHNIFMNIWYSEKKNISIFVYNILLWRWIDKNNIISKKLIYMFLRQPNDVLEKREDFHDYSHIFTSI